MAETQSIELNANEVWRVLKAFEQALEVLAGELLAGGATEPTEDPAYERYLSLYERFRALSDLLPEPDIEREDAQSAAEDEGEAEDVELETDDEDKDEDEEDAD